MIRKVRICLLLTLLVYVSAYFVVTRIFIINYTYSSHRTGKQICVFFYLNNPYEILDDKTQPHGVSNYKVLIAHFFWPIMILDPAYESAIFYHPNHLDHFPPIQRQ